MMRSDYSLRDTGTRQHIGVVLLVIAIALLLYAPGERKEARRDKPENVVKGNFGALGLAANF